MQATTRSTARIDNILRQKLMIGDPSDATEVARGLEQKFAGQAEILERDRTGQSSATARAPISRLTSPAEGDLAKARDDVGRDLMGLIAEPQLKDVTPELRGWQGAIMRLIDDGAGAATLALDQRQRDRVFDCRRSLGDYARLARLLGAATPQFNGPYRQLAKGLDEAAALLLVLAGEAIADKSGGGARPLAAPASDLRARRDAVLSAVRTLNGSTDKSYDTDEWPRGLHAYRELNEALQESGHGELRSMLNENHLARSMDALIDQANGNNAQALRALGATAGVTLGKFERFLDLANQPDPESPPLATLRNALRLFIDSFEGAPTSRLVAVSQPAILGTSLQQSNAADDGQRRLLDLVQHRGTLAFALDCYLGCDCKPDQVTCQVVFDKLLYDTDRAIDLYLQSTDGQGDGPAEQRAAAFGLLILVIAIEDLRDEFPKVQIRIPPKLKTTLDTLRDCRAGHNARPLLDPRISLGKIALQLYFKPEEQLKFDELSRRMQSEICMQRRNEERWFELADSMAVGCIDLAHIRQTIDNLLEASIFALTLGTECDCPDTIDDIPPDIATSLAAVAYERYRNGFQPKGEEGDS